MSDEPREPEAGTVQAGTVPPSLIDYNRMVKRALLAVVRDALRLAAEEGLPGDHHFLIELATTADGVEIPAFLRSQYPESMRIILQNQYWNLKPGDEAFSVDLRFGGRMCSLTIPYSAVTAFIDPAAQLGLRFEIEADEVPAAEDEPAEDDQQEADVPVGRVVSFDAFRNSR